MHTIQKSAQFSVVGSGGEYAGLEGSLVISESQDNKAYVHICSTRDDIFGTIDFNLSKDDCYALGKLLMEIGLKS